MSLDLLKCKIVPKEQANEAIMVSGTSWEWPHNFALRKLQEFGIVVFRSERVGRNCMNEKWHRMYELLLPSSYDYGDEEVKAQTKLDEMLIIFPDELGEKLIPFVELEKVGDFINWGDDWDFLYISW